jgi:glycosyltransferase involved in cell wall biosynthesis
MKGKCSIFFYDGYVGIAPTIINLSILFDRYDYKTKVYGTKTHYPKTNNLGKQTKVFYFLKGNRLFDLFRKQELTSILPFLKLALYNCQCLFDILKTKYFEKKAPQINIGVDIYGAISCLINFYLFRQNFLFLSLELHEPDRYQGWGSLIGKLARLAYQNSEGLIIQDEDRFKTFCKYYDYIHPQVIYLPNSTLTDENQTLSIDKENFFRQKFNLNELNYPYLVLQAGMICDAVLSKTLAQTFTEIDNGSALIYHERSQRNANEDRYIQELQKINSQNLFLSLDPVPYELIGKIYSAPTIGLAFYADLGNNFSQIAMASGKLCQYLQYGKPILVNNLPSLVNLIDKYNCGIVIKNPKDSKEIQKAIETIANNYQKYSDNAKNCFKEEFDFAKKAEPIFSLIEGL